MSQPPLPPAQPITGGDNKPKIYPKGMLGKVQKVLDKLNDQVASINSSKIFAGIIIIILNIASKYVNMNLSKTVEGYLKYSFSRNILVFAATWMGTRDIYIALTMTLIFILVVDVFMNEECDYCVLPESFVDYHVDKMATAPNNQSQTQNSSTIDVKNLTSADIQTMQTILDKIRSANK